MTNNCLTLCKILSSDKIKSMPEHLFTSARLGYRNWTEKDKIPFYQMNANPQVMQHFPNKLNQTESDELWQRLYDHYIDYGYTYFAVDELSSNQLIGFIGIKNQNYQYQYTPFVDIGWRLDPKFWGKGYATEGAKACLDFGFNTVKLNEIYAVAVNSNSNSFRVMEKIGMIKIDTFNHPAMKEDHPFQPCHCYKIKKLSE